MKVFENIILSFAILLDKLSINLKNTVRDYKLKLFLSKYNLKDGIFIPKKDRRFNPYEGTNLVLVDKLIKSKIVIPSDCIMDVGCGAGLFLLYLCDHGFSRLYGIEMNDILYNICKTNIYNFSRLNENTNLPIVQHGNAIVEQIPDNVDCFFFYNPFHDNETYRNWVLNLNKSLKRNFRIIKLIFLYPTLAVLDTMKEFIWFERINTFICYEQVCYKCIKFVVYTNSKQDEN